MLYAEISNLSQKGRDPEKIIFWIVLAISVFIAFLMYRNTTKFVKDPHAYPIQMEVITDFGDNLCKRIPLDTLWNGQELFLDLHFGLPSVSNYVQLSSYNETSIVSRINLESSELDKGSPVNYTFQKYLRGCGEKFGTLYVTSYSEFDTKLLRINLDEGKNKGIIDTISVLSVNDFKLNKDSWDCGYTGMNCFPEDNQGPLDVFIQVGSGTSKYPRYFIGYEIGKNRNFIEKFRKQIGSPLRDPCFYDIDGDGSYEIIFGTSAPSNGKHGSGLSDSNQYVVAFNQRGEVVWKQNLGVGGGNTMISPHPIEDSLMVATRRICAFSEEANSSYIYSFQPWDGTILDTTRIEGIVVGTFENNEMYSSMWFWVVDRKKKSIGWIDKDFNVSHVRTFPFALNHLAVGTINVKGEHYFMLNLLNGWAGVVDKNLKLKGVFQGEFELIDKEIDKDNITDDYYFRKCNTRNINGDNVSRYIHINMVKKPWAKWFAWRNRWLIVAWLILLAAIPGLISVVKYVRLKIAARKAIEEMNEKLSLLIQRLHKSQEEERALLSKEVHDNIGQSIVVLRWGIDSIDPDSNNSESLRKSKGQLKAGVEELLKSIHDISSGIRPSILDDAGLFQALVWLTQNLEDRTGIKCNCKINSTVETESRDLNTALFRVVQEAFTNVIKHASASEVTVQVEEKNNELLIKVVDNGRGVIQKENGHRKSLGILGMNERLKEYGGVVKLKNNKKSGATLSVVLPLKKLQSQQKVANHE